MLQSIQQILWKVVIIRRQVLLCLLACQKCFWMARWTGIRAPSAVRFHGDEDKQLSSLPSLLQRRAIKAAYLEMTSARSPAQRESALLSSSFFPRSLFCPEQTHGELQRCKSPQTCTRQTAGQGSAWPAAVAQNKINGTHPTQTPLVALYYQMIWTLTQPKQNLILSPQIFKKFILGLERSQGVCEP